MSRPVAVEAAGLTKRFGRHEVLRGVDLHLRSGLITGLVGPNAAGKTTLMKCILGLVRPDGGTLSVLGQAPRDGEDYRRRVGYMPQAARFPDNLTGREILAMLRDLRGGGQSEDIELLNWFQFDGQLDKPIRALSGGTRQKLSASLAFLFRPELLILDEPTAGLDPVASGLFKEKLTQVRDRGATVLLASHALSELEEVADEIVFLLEGQVRFHGPIADLRRVTGFTRLERGIAALMQRGAVA